MQQFVYSVYDEKAKAYITPFFMHNDDMAIRIFTECAMSADHQFGRFPADYSLWRLGSWEDQKAVFTAERKVPVITGLEARAAMQKVDKQQLSLIDNVINGEDQDGVQESE